MSSPNDEIRKLANEALQAALNEAEAGQVEQARALYQAVLELLPGHAQAHFGLGLLERQAGQAGAAIPHFANALQAAPDEEAHWLGYLDALMEARQFATARELIELGRSHGLQGPQVDAVEAQLAREGAPTDREIEAAVKVYTQGEKDAAGEIALALTERFPQHPFGWKLLGGVLHGKRAYPEALEAMQKAATYGPDDVETLCNLALMLKRAGALDETQAVLERAIALEPANAKAHNYLAATLHQQGLLDEALASANTALSCDPGYVEVWSSLGVILENLGRAEEAIEAYRRVLAHDPDQTDAHGNMLFCMSHMDSVTPGELFEEHLRYGRRLEARFPMARAWPVTPDPERPLRIGFVSGDLRHHAIANFAEPIFRQLRERPGLVVHAYYNYPLHDETTLRLRDQVAHWRDVAALDDTALEALVRADGIDVLFDLSGHTAHNRLHVFARKPAPLQVSWLGYPGTTGLAAMDYYLCDPYLVPPGQFDHLFTEKLVYLPAVAFQPAPDAPGVGPLPALANGHLTFGSFNRLSKISRQVIGAWGSLLRALPDARLVVAGLPVNGVGQDKLQAWLREEGIDAARTSFHGRMSPWDYLKLHKEIDICLDTFPYSGGTTTTYALYMGVPTLTLASESIPGRQTACLLSHHGLQEFIADDAQDFVNKGLAASRDLAALAHIRATLRDTSPLWTPQGLVRIADGFEGALRQMWRRWCAGLPPASFGAPPGHAD